MPVAQRPMDLLAAFRTYVRVAESGSFSAVARELGATQPAISRQVAALEEHLGARLIQRTTRSLTLTEDGRDLLGHALRVLDTVDEAEAAVGRRHAAPSGLIRLAAPASFGRLYVAPRMPRLLARYPDLLVELRMSDTVADLVADGIDLVGRVLADGVARVTNEPSGLDHAFFALPGYGELAADLLARAPPDIRRLFAA